MKSEIIETLFDWNSTVKINLDGYNELKFSYKNKEKKFLQSLSNNKIHEYELLIDEFLTLSCEDGTIAFKCGFEHGVKSVANIFGKGC